MDTAATATRAALPQAGDEVIRTNGLRKEYREVTALAGLNLSVPKNSIYGFLGPNGSGKSTTIKLLLGLIKPTAGSGSIFGHDIVRDSVAIRHRVGYLAQEPRYYEQMTAREVLRYTARFFYTGPRDLIEERVAETLGLAGLSDKADRAVKGFSGGERQRLGIAQAQVNYPDLLILDEPAASLDPQGRHDVLSVMERLRKYTTIFYSTHILDDVQRVSDRVAILNKGALIAEAPISQLLSGGSSSMIYGLTLRGDPARAAAARERVLAETWARSVNVVPQEAGVTWWQVSVDNDAAAESRLLRVVLADEGLDVIAFGRKTYELEDIFLRLVDGSNSNGH